MADLSPGAGVLKASDYRRQIHPAWVGLVGFGRVSGRSSKLRGAMAAGLRMECCDHSP